ncbi:MAG: hypothetical protein ACLFN5_01495 [bacterium]
MTQAVVLQKSFIVAGHPRSGTSLACRLVSGGGVEFPSDFEGDQYNRDGYFELRESKELSKRLLEKAMTEENTQLMNKIVRRLNSIEGRSGLKLVRIPAFFFYRHIAKNLKALFIFRNPANVKASLFKRGIGTFPISWLKNNNALIAAYENCEQSIIVSYESLLNRETHLEAGFQKLGLNVDFECIKKSCQTQKDSRIYVTQDEINLYERLKELEKESCEG